MSPESAIYDYDLASSDTYDLTTQDDDLSRQPSVEPTGQRSPVSRAESAAPVASAQNLANLLNDPSPKRRALRLALAMVVGRDEGLLARRNTSRR